MITFFTSVICLNGPFERFSLTGPYVTSVGCNLLLEDFKYILVFFLLSVLGSYLNND